MTAYYIAPAELNIAPLGVPWATLATAPLTPAHLQQWYCQSVSAMVDNICGEQVSLPRRPYMLRATFDSETANTDTQEKTFIDNHGYLVYEATYRPIVSVVSGTWIPLVGAGMTGGSPVAWDMTSVYWEKKEIVHVGLFDQFRFQSLRVSVNYIDGFANALLTSPITTASTSMAVDDATGITPGQVLTCYDMPPEPLVVSSSFVPFQGAGTVALAASPVSAHATGVRVSAMGADLQQACLYLVQHLVKTKALFGQAPAWQANTPSNIPRGGSGQTGSDYYQMAQKLLQQYVLTP